jgi:putative nucleotidyltransferase with HDIG domain
MMTKERTNRGDLYQTGISVAGMVLWVISAARIITGYGWREQLLFVALVPAIISLGRFVQHFRLPLGLKFTRERITFTLTDAFVLLAACWFGLVPAVFLAGIEGFTSSRRTVRRLSSNLFSSGMMSLGAAAASVSLSLVLRYGFGEETGTGRNHALLAAAVAMLVGSIVQIAVNVGLFSTLFILRQDNRATDLLRGFLWAVPMFLPNSAAATLIYFAFQHDLKIIVVICVPVFLAIYFGQRQYRDGVQKRIAVMEKAHRETIEALAVAINAKDEVTHEHVIRVQIYAAGVARILGCSPDEIEALKAGALLHDIGKIAVPDYILNKPGKLTAAEFEKMKFHTIAGAQILSRVEFPYPIVPVVRHHHEHWDGKGYPDGLSGEDIPLTARILTVVDCFDAVREDRQYRKGMTREEAIDLIIRGSGTQYDPRVVGSFIACLQEFEAEIRTHRGSPLPTFGIEPSEQLSEAARRVLPAAGLAEEEADKPSGEKGPGELKALCDLARAVISAVGKDEIVAAFAETLNSVIPYCSCAITLVDPVTGNSTVTNAVGQHWLSLRGRTIAPGEGVTGWVLANRKPFCNEDPKLDLPPSVIEQSPDYRTLAAFPIINDSVLYGAVTVYSSALAEYTQGHQKLMGEAVALMATALAATTHTDAWEKRASTDDDGLSPLAEAGSSLGLAETVLEYELTH